MLLLCHLALTAYLQETPTASAEKVTGRARVAAESKLSAISPLSTPRSVGRLKVELLPDPDGNSPAQLGITAAATPLRKGQERGLRMKAPQSAGKPLLSQSEVLESVEAGSVWIVVEVNMLLQPL